MGKKLKNMADTNLLLTITIVVFFVMYIGAIVFQGKDVYKRQVRAGEDGADPVAQGGI